MRHNQLRLGISTLGAEKNLLFVFEKIRRSMEYRMGLNVSDSDSLKGFSRMLMDSGDTDLNHEKCMTLMRFYE